MKTTILILIATSIGGYFLGGAFNAGHATVSTGKLAATLSPTHRLTTDPTTGANRDDGRDFAGIYEVATADESAGGVRLVFRFRLTNHSGEDVSGATVILSGATAGPPVGALPGVSIPDRGSVVLGGEFTVPRVEYDVWRRDGAPEAAIEYQNAAGENLRRMVELSRIPISEVQ